jgi:hypothetical protein
MFSSKTSKESSPKPRRFQYQNSSGNDEINHGKVLRNWFLKLPVEERARVLTFQDKEGITTIKHMVAIKLKNGDGLFYALEEEDMKSHPLQFDNNLCFLRISLLSYHCFYSQRLLDQDKQLEEYIRLCDKCDYLDTICVAPSMLEDAQRFLKLMTTASRGGFLRHPCRGI